MADRPTLHLTNFASRTQHKGVVYSAMALPRRFEYGDGGIIQAAAPDVFDLRAIQEGRISLEVYRDRCEARFHAAQLAGRLTPGRMRPEGHPSRPVWRLATLCCACPRPDSPRRTHPCHIEWLAPFLVRAGWRVVLYGQEVTDG